MIWDCDRSLGPRLRSTAIATKKRSARREPWRPASTWFRSLSTGPSSPVAAAWPAPFGYDAAHYDTSIAMAELSLLPAVRKTDPETTVIVANGTSCRHQIEDGTGREAMHIARLLERSVVSGQRTSS